MTTLSFTNTRARRDDVDTSREAAKAAVTRKADAERVLIRRCVGASEGMTAREVADKTGLDYYTVQRRISETGLTKTKQVRDAARVWVAV